MKLLGRIVLTAIVVAHFGGVILNARPVQNILNNLSRIFTPNTKGWMSVSADTERRWISTVTTRTQTADLNTTLPEKWRISFIFDKINYNACPEKTSG
ncbi:MAG: hypothetical protein J6L64_00085 [Opitutales bacterium]|nr:hypothetical protein [Opitutales bacterium]